MLIAQLQRSPMEHLLLALAVLAAGIVVRLQGLGAAGAQPMQQMPNGSLVEFQGQADLRDVLTVLTAMKNRPTNSRRNGEWHDRPPCDQGMTS